MRVVSLFAGVGGIDLALQRAGIPTVAAVEIDPAARGVLADRFPDAALFSDVREVSSRDLVAAGFHPGVDILTGGFPCQDLSVAGKRAGLAGARSGLYFEIIRLAANLRPSYLILENVPGLLSSHGGRDMGAVVGALGDLGMRWAYRVLDAQFFGVPQRRRRVVIVASAAGWADPGEILLESESSSGNPAPGGEEGQEAALPAVVSTLQGGGKRGYRVDAEAAAGGHLIPVAFHLTQDPISGSMSPALSAGSKAGCSTIGVMKDLSVRRLTPLECERLQGFPDGWTETSNGRQQSDSARYRQLGNAVAVPVIEWVARRLMEHTP